MKNREQLKLASKPAVGTITSSILRDPKLSPEQRKALEDRIAVKMRLKYGRIVKIEPTAKFLSEQKAAQRKGVK